MSRLVVKCGGAVMADAAETIDALAAHADVCVVHGAGPQITAEMERHHVPVRFVGGRRVTTPAGLAIVRRALVEANRSLCAALGARAVGLIGDEIGLEATRILELGLVGDPLPSRPPAVEDALDAGRIPVVAPLAAGPLNVNADEAAAALAVGLGAERLLFVTDVPGLLHAGAVVPEIQAVEADLLLSAGELEGGIVPKLRAAVTAARLGVQAEIGETAVLA
ncbi:MAG: acetylglutamate kinase [Gaiellaceae bacterium]